MEPLTIFIILVFSVLILSGLISGSEAALLSLSYPKAKEVLKLHPDSNKAKKLVLIKENIQEYITTLVVLNNIVNIVGSILIGVLATKIFGEVYLGVVSAAITFLIILFSEIIPKIYGDQYSKEISLTIALPLFYATILLKPISFILHFLTSLFVKKSNDNSISEGEIKEMAALGKETGSIEHFESEVIENVFRMNDVSIYDIMVPKHKVATLDKKSSYEEVINLAKETGYTRFPVLHNQEVIGMVNVKDLLKFYGRESEFSISKVLRKIIFAPETMKLSTLEKRFKSSRIHMAVIVNEHGEFTGIVTYEDIIEEIIGDISDEYDDDEEQEIVKIKENKYHILASIEISTLNEELELSLPENEDYSTLNGFLICKLDKIPVVNETYEIDQGVFRIIKRSKKKIIEVEFIKS